MEENLSIKINKLLNLVKEKNYDGIVDLAKEIAELDPNLELLVVMAQDLVDKPKNENVEEIKKDK